MTLLKLSNHYPSLFEHFVDNDVLNWPKHIYSANNVTIPAVNIKEGAEEFEVNIAAPGLTKSDFKIELNNDLLTISSEKKDEKEVRNGEQFTRKEFSYQSFTRSFTLPHSVDGENIGAKYENGILNLVIPKKEEAKPKAPKQIAVA